MSKILVIDDDRSIRETLELYLTEEGYEVVTAATGTEGLNRFVETSPDVVILDIRLPDVDGFTVLEDLREDEENVKVIMITAHHDMDSTISAMKGGAFDYIHKPVNVDELDMAIKKALKTREMEQKIDGLLMEPSRHFKVGDIIGTGKEMREIFKTIGVVSQNRTTILIQGESGTGKELIAKVIHHNTARDEPYIAVNCSAIVETLLESELFGHEKGSFTGAIARKLGKFELARYGTVFLDEISEMSLNLQAKLLRVLQEMEFERVGGKDRVRVHARIIAATNKDLAAQVKAGTFRQDLFYRLNVIPLHIPPLRERRDAILPLAEYFIGALSVEFGTLPKRISPEAQRLLLDYDWPGNIRELKNLIERIMLLEPADTIAESTLNASLLRGEATAAGAPAAYSAEDDLRTATQKAAQAVERAYLAQTLESCGGNIAECARRAGVNRSHLYTLLNKHNLRAPQPPS